MWDFAVVGGGIAGLAIAEMLQRSGASVLLLEKNRTLCAEASAEQQGWFHTGALYTALPNNFFCRTMVGNLDDLVDYYSGFPSMNLRVDKHIFTTDRAGWLSNRTSFYVYANSKGVGWKWRLPWALALYRAKRRMSWFESLDASRSLSHQMGFGAKPLQYVVHGSTLGINLENVAFTLKSRDRAMDTRLIAEDLLRSFLTSGGTVKMQTKVLSLERGYVLAQETTDDTLSRFYARHTILAAGKTTSTFDKSVHVFVSPILVVHPALSDINFVKMSPHTQDTINHICHRRNGLEYSVIGNAAYYDVQDFGAESLERARSYMLGLGRKVFGDFDEKGADLFFGYKTEIVSSSFMRNYLYHIVDQGAYTIALPGKFTLCFSLAVNVCRHFGIEPVERVKLKNEEVRHYIEDPTHYRLAKQLALKGNHATDLSNLRSEG